MKKRELKSQAQPGMAVYIYNPRTQKAETHLGYLMRPYPNKTKQKVKQNLNLKK
jgi:hypothetical protein